MDPNTKGEGWGMISIHAFTASMLSNQQNYCFGEQIGDMTEKDPLFRSNYGYCLHEGEWMVLYTDI